MEKIASYSWSPGKPFSTYSGKTWVLRAPNRAATTAIAANAKAADLSAVLARTALDHATLTGWVQR